MSRADPLVRHTDSADRVIASGDAGAIKQLYTDLGDDWWKAHCEGNDVPVLSLPETLPAVTTLMAGRQGLVLDAGCGPNPAVSIQLAGDPSTNIVSLDLGIGTVRLARAIAAERGARLLGIVGDVERLPFRDGAFDGLVCDDTIEHLPDDRAGVAELARVLKRGVTAVLATPNRHNLFIVRQRVRDLLRGIRRPLDHYFVANSHIREYTWTEFERLVAPAFRVRCRAPVGWAGPTRKRRVTPFLRLPFGERLGQMIVVEVERRSDQECASSGTSAKQSGRHYHVRSHLGR